MAVPVGSQFVPDEPNQEWMARHVLQSRYALQIVKCADHSCCEAFQTNWSNVFPDRFLPAPAVVEYGPEGQRLVAVEAYLKHPDKYQFCGLQTRLLLKTAVQPFDAFCPSLQDRIQGFVCPVCRHYWPSEAAMKRHKTAVHGRSAPAAARDHKAIAMPIRNIFNIFSNFQE